MTYLSRSTRLFALLLLKLAPGVLLETYCAYFATHLTKLYFSVFPVFSCSLCCICHYGTVEGLNTRQDTHLALKYSIIAVGAAQERA